MGWAGAGFGGWSLGLNGPHSDIPLKKKKKKNQTGSMRLVYGLELRCLQRGWFWHATSGHSSC